MRLRAGLVVFPYLATGLKIPMPFLRSRGKVEEPRPAEMKPMYEPSVPVAINGGDPWVGWRVSGTELNELVEAATSTIRGRPVMKQFHPRRSWLWQQWHGTIVRSVLQNEVKLNMAWAICAVGCVWHLLPRVLLSLHVPCADVAAPTLASFREMIIASLKPVENFWPLTQTLVTLVLSFFLSQTYFVWRDVYSIARKVQGRLSDQGLILATNGERDGTNSKFTRRAITTMETYARYARLFNMLFFASVTRRFAPLATPKGLQALQTQGSVTADEVERLISTTSWHQTVALWMATLVKTGVEDGRITGGSAVSYQSNVNIATLRAHYAQMADKLSGRMPLAYTHLVQLFVDTLCFAARLAFGGSLGAFGAVLGTGIVTLFYAGVLALAKMFLDPFDNEDYGGRSGIRLEADTLVQEVNALTRRWTTAARAGIPDAVYSQPPELIELTSAHHNATLNHLTSHHPAGERPKKKPKDPTSDDDYFFAPDPDIHMGTVIDANYVEEDDLPSVTVRDVHLDVDDDATALRANPENFVDSPSVDIKPHHDPEAAAKPVVSIKFQLLPSAIRSLTLRKRRRGPRSSSSSSSSSEGSP